MRVDQRRRSRDLRVDDVYVRAVSAAGNAGTLLGKGDMLGGKQHPVAQPFRHGLLGNADHTGERRLRSGDANAFGEGLDAYSEW